MQASFIYHIYQMNKKYLYELKISKSEVLQIQTSPSLSSTSRNDQIQLNMPLLN
jgi:hypothetical protein